MLLPRVSRVRNPTRIFTSGLSLLQQTHTPMTFGHSHDLLVVPLQGFGGLLLCLTQKHRNVEEADLQRHASRISVSGTVIVCCPLTYTNPRHRARAEVFATYPSKLKEQFGLTDGAE